MDLHSPNQQLLSDRMRPFFLEPIFWASAHHATLRSLGLSRKRAHRVMVRAEPVWLADELASQPHARGVFATRVVMADSEAQARVAAVALVRDAVLAFARNSQETPVLLEVEESNAVAGVVWRQPRGFSIWEES